MDIIINKENGLGTYTPNAKKGLLKSVNKRPLADVLNVFDPKERKSPGCSKSPIKEKGCADFDDLKYILKQSEFDAPVEAAKEKIRSISPAFGSCIKSLPEELDDDNCDESDYFLKYQELDEPDDFHDIIPRLAWPNKDELNRIIYGFCESYIDSKNYVQDHYIDLKQPVDKDYNMYDDDNISSVSEVSFCSSIDSDMFSDDENDD